MDTRMGMCICNDRRWPETFRVMGLQSAEVVVLGYNDDPPVPGKGSAIFLHLARPGYTPTEGCVALGEADMETFLARVKPGDSVRIAV
jgi:L,D-peptidoglycan transpeptidase YkuD (ErfK/YbiS/YcfS/YnhG family)